MTTTPNAVPDVSEMAAVHRVFRNAFTTAPMLINSVTDGDTARANVVGSYYLNILEFLQVHHSGEDELIFPRLIERSGAAQPIEILEQQHDVVDELASHAVDSLTRWISTGTSSDGQRFGESWSALGAVLTAHMDEEEEVVLPLVEQYISLEEWQELPGHAMGSFKGDNLFLILGLVREQMTQAQRDAMLDGMPAPAADAWRSVGIAAYTQTVADLMGAKN